MLKKHCIHAVALLCLLLVGCKYTAFTHEGAVKATTEEFFRYLNKAQWNAAADLMDLDKFEFSFANGVSFGRGYPAKELTEAINRALGWDNTIAAVLVGVAVIAILNAMRTERIH